MKNYEEIAPNSYGAILKKARGDYSKRNNIKLGQKELAQKLGIAPSTVGLWEQGRRKIPPIHYKELNNLLHTNFKNTNEIVDNLDLYSIIGFYFGLFNFTKKQYDFIMGKLLIKYCKSLLTEDKIDNIKKLSYNCQINKLFSNDDKSRMNKCYSYIIKYLKKHSKKYSTNDIYTTFTSFDSSLVVNETHINIPVYNSSGIIEFHEQLPLKFSNDNYKYIYAKIDNTKKNLPDKYITGTLVLIRLGNFCFQNEDIIIQIGNSFKIEHIHNKTDMELLKKDYEQWLIEDYKIIGSIVMIDYSTSSINHPDYKITF